jgi:DNA-binding response OmpR family regulator
VQRAWNAESAVQLAQEQDFDLITLDIDLPGTSGFEICGLLKRLHRSRKTPVLFVSGRASEEDQQRAGELGAVDYIIKPFEVTDFIFRLKSHAKASNDSADVPSTEGAAA